VASDRLFVNLLLRRHFANRPAPIQEKHGSCSPALAPVATALVYLRQLLAFLCRQGQRLGFAGHREKSSVGDAGINA